MPHYGARLPVRYFCSRTAPHSLGTAWLRKFGTRWQHAEGTRKALRVTVSGLGRQPQLQAVEWRTRLSKPWVDGVAGPTRGMSAWMQRPWQATSEHWLTHHGEVARQAIRDAQLTESVVHVTAKVSTQDVCDA